MSDAPTVAPRVSSLLLPIPGPAPAGADVRYTDPRYLLAETELEKLTSPRGEVIAWAQVVEATSALLAEASKDLRLGAWLGIAWAAVGGAVGVRDGAHLLAGLLSGFADGLFPPVKGRASLLSLYLKNTVGRLRLRGDVVSSPRDATEALQAVRHLQEVAQARLPGGLYSFTDLIATLERAAPAPAPVARTDQTVQPAPPAAPTAAAPPVAAPPQRAAPAGPRGLGELAAELEEVAHGLRRARANDPEGYRLLRAVAWGVREPPAVEGTVLRSRGRGDGAWMASLETMAANELWGPLLEETESGMDTTPYCLDLQRFTCDALDGLGASFAAARQAVVGELRALLARRGDLPGLVLGDGSAVASEKTRAWLAEQRILGGGGAAVTPPAPARGANSPGGAGEDPVRAARALAAKHPGKEAIAALQAAVATAPDARHRFALRLELAEACRRLDKSPVALELHKALERELSERGLESWEPALAGLALRAMIAAARDAGDQASEARAFGRLCLVAP